MVLFLILCLGTAAANRPAPIPQDASPTPSGLTIIPPLEPTPTPLPLELQQNRFQTIGLTIASTILVIIVIVGVFRALLPVRPEDR